MQPSLSDYSTVKALNVCEHIFQIKQLNSIPTKKILSIETNWIENVYIQGDHNWTINMADYFAVEKKTGK